jgi:hypothetical protein
MAAHSSIMHLRNCETPRVAILSKQKCLFSKTEDRKVKQVLSGGWHQWEEDLRKGCRK